MYQEHEIMLAFFLLIAISRLSLQLRVAAPSLWDPTLDWPPVTSQAVQTSTLGPPPPNVDFAPVCDLTPASCPACDGWWSYTSINGSQYRLYCDATVRSVSSFNAEGRYPPEKMAEACIAACDDSEACTGASVDIAGGTCSLAILRDTASPFPPAVPSPLNGSMAYVRVMNQLPLPTPAVDPVPLPAPVCSLDQWSCPACDEVKLNDSAGKRYEIRCGFFMFSVSLQVINRATSIDDCMKECEALELCTAANWWDYNCILTSGLGYKKSSARDWITLVRGGDIQPDPVPSMSVGPPRFGSAPAEPSSTSVDDGPSSTVVNTDTSSQIFSILPWWPNTGDPSMMITAQETPTSYSYPEYSYSYPAYSWSMPAYVPCKKDYAPCPACDWAYIEGSPGESYRLNCERGPTCRGDSRVIPAQNVSDCMHACDQDEDCFGGRFDTNASAPACTLCHGRPVSGNSYPGQVGFVYEMQQVYPSISYPSWTAGTTTDGIWWPPVSMPTPLPMPLPELSGSTPASTSVELTSVPSLSGFSSVTVATATTKPLPPQPFSTDLAPLTCPAADQIEYDFGLYRPYRLMCDVVPDSYGAYMAANGLRDIFECAKMCQGCYAFSWNQAEGYCQAYESFERYYGIHPLVVNPAPGITAGVIISSVSDPGIVTSTRQSTTTTAEPSVVTTMYFAPLASSTPARNLCPQADRTQYTVPAEYAGATFDVLCGVFPEERNLVDGAWAGGFTEAADFDACASFCSLEDGCNKFVWRPSDGTCQLYREFPEPSVTVFLAADNTAGLKSVGMSYTITTASESMQHAPLATWASAAPYTLPLITPAPAMSDSSQTQVIETFMAAPGGRRIRHGQ